MKKIIFICLFLVINKISCAVGCKDYSYHAQEPNKIDYKTLHYVNCSCNCKKYKQVNSRCVNCRHYMDNEEDVFIK